MEKRRVVVTGLGAVTPIGNTVEEFWASIKEGKVGIGPITKFDASDFKVKIAAEVKGFVAKERMDFKAAKRMEPFSQYAVAAAKEAFADSGIDMEKEQHSKLIADIPEPDIAISMGCNVECPFIGRPFDDNWGLDDPTGKSDEDFIKVINQIELKIKNMIDRMK